MVIFHLWNAIEQKWTQISRALGKIRFRGAFTFFSAPRWIEKKAIDAVVSLIIYYIIIFFLPKTSRIPRNNSFIWSIECLRESLLSFLKPSSHTTHKTHTPTHHKILLIGKKIYEIIHRQINIFKSKRAHTWWML